MTTTTNLGLKKPDQSDGVNVGDLNSNMDALDQEIKGLKDKFSPEGSAKDADKLGGKAAGDYALSGHKHDGVYAPTAHNHSGIYAPATHSHTPAEAGATPAAHGSDTTIHVTAADKTNWNGKAAGSHNHSGVYEPANGNLVKTNMAASMTAELKANGASAIGTAQVRNIYAGTGDMTAGVTGLTTGVIYFVYE